MILLDELDAREKEKRESLPPYTPRKSFRIPVISTPPSSVSGFQSLSTRQTRTSLHPRSASAFSANYDQSQSSLTINSNISSQTLHTPLPTSPAPGLGFGPSTSQLSIPLSSPSFPALPSLRAYPPPYLRPSNNVYVERESASITGSFLVDPALQIPDCLLPDDPDVLLVRGGSAEGFTSSKAKEKLANRRRANVCLVTRSGDICVDIWIREGYAKQRIDHTRRHRDGSSVGSQSSGGSLSGRPSSESQESMDNWRSDWTSPPPSHPWPVKTKSRVDIDIRSETGSITVRIHAQSHQRLRIQLSSAQGSIAVGVPRTFAGYVQANAHARRSDSADYSVSSPGLGSNFGSSGSSCSSYLVPTPNTWQTTTERDSSSMGDRSTLVAEKVLGEIAQAFPTITMRQPVSFSIEMERIVTPLSEHRKSGRGRYLVGDAPSEFFSEHMGARYLDELHFESNTGTMGVFFNDEVPQQKSDTLIMKLFHKAR